MELIAPCTCLEVVYGVDCRFLFATSENVLYTALSLLRQSITASILCGAVNASTVVQLRKHIGKVE